MWRLSQRGRLTAVTSKQMMNFMSTTSDDTEDAEFTSPGTIRVSTAALKFARDFGEAVKGMQRGDYVVAFDWAESISMRRAPNEPLENIGSCLMVGAYEREQVPARCIQTIEGFEFVIKIPSGVWEKSVKRLIDLDPEALFKLALR